MRLILKPMAAMVVVCVVIYLTPPILRRRSLLPLKGTSTVNADETMKPLDGTPLNWIEGCPARPNEFLTGLSKPLRGLVKPGKNTYSLISTSSLRPKSDTAADWSRLQAKLLDTTRGKPLHVHVAGPSTTTGRRCIRPQSVTDSLSEPPDNGSDPRGKQYAKNER